MRLFCAKAEKFVQMVDFSWNYVFFVKNLFDNWNAALTTLLHFSAKWLKVNRPESEETIKSIRLPKSSSTGKVPLDKQNAPLTTLLDVFLPATEHFSLNVRQHQINYFAYNVQVDTKMWKFIRLPKSCHQNTNIKVQPIKKQIPLEMVSKICRMKGRQPRMKNSPTFQKLIAHIKLFAVLLITPRYILLKNVALKK